MKQLHENRYIDAFIKTILLFAGIHIVLLAVHAVVHQRYESLNLFHILQLNLFFPEIVYGGSWFVLGIVVLVAVYSIMYTYYSKHSK
jgi:hypothetical protein